MLAKGQIGALFNITTARDANKYQKLAIEKSRLHIPLLFGLDVIHGFRTEFPIPLGLASTWDPEIVEKAARVAAREASASGVRWAFSPMVDIARDARWGRSYESYAEDPQLVARYAHAMVRGLQGRAGTPDFMSPGHTLVSVKHFLGDGSTGVTGCAGVSGASVDGWTLALGNVRTSAVAGALEDIMISLDCQSD